MAIAYHQHVSIDLFGLDDDFTDAEREHLREKLTDLLNRQGYDHLTFSFD